MPDPSPLLWHNPAWQDEAHTWIRAATKENSIQITGEIEQYHAYAWSTVMRVPTHEGPLFFKATAGETTFEIALTKKLSGWFPDCMPELVAVDTERGWMLMRDGGEQLRSSIRPTKDISPWKPVITRYSEVQIGLAEHVNEILALGVPDHRLGPLPSLYAELLKDEASMMIGQEKGLTPAEVQLLHNKLPRINEICARLAAFGIPETLNNGDFHDGNVLLKDGRITFFDWGDATVTHPFVTLRTFFVSMEIALELDDYAPPTSEMIALRDRYLERWERFASKEDLLKAYELSRPVASIVKALLWHATISQLDGALREKYAWIIPELWKEFLMYERLLAE